MAAVASNLVLAEAAMKTIFLLMAQYDGRAIIPVDAVLAEGTFPPAPAHCRTSE